MASDTFSNLSAPLLEDGVAHSCLTELNMVDMARDNEFSNEVLLGPGSQKVLKQGWDWSAGERILAPRGEATHQPRPRVALMQSGPMRTASEEQPPCHLPSQLVRED